MVVQLQKQEPNIMSRRLCTRAWRQGTRGLLAVWLLIGAACGVTEDNLPPDLPDPNSVRTADGARRLALEAERQFSTAIERVIMASGLMTDELAALPVPVGTTVASTALDSRQNLSLRPHFLHRLRAQAREARNALEASQPDSLVRRARMYTLEGYAEIYLADLFCSGIPLSTVDFDGSYTLASGSTTAEVYRHALGLFDTALTLVSSGGIDAVIEQYGAALGRGRALLALGRVAEAGAAVAVVPDGFEFLFAETRWSTPPNGQDPPFGSASITPPNDSLMLVWYWSRVTTSSTNNRRLGAPTVADQEGINGLNYRTSGDPRVATKDLGKDPGGRTFFGPRKYEDALAPLTVRVAFLAASAVEARLIEAEAALNANTGDGLWLQRLNHLRQNAWTHIRPATSGPLPDLTDPGTDAARLDLLFRERAFWLYLTGTRQGDMRRLIRQYGRDPSAVYPVGAYPGGVGEYGSSVVIPMPDEERILNRLYSGCFNFNA